MNIGVFASGRGSNFQAIFDAIQQELLPARVTLVLSNKGDAGVLELARALSLPAVHLSHKQFPDEASFASAMLDALKKHDVHIIALAGYLRKIPSGVVREYRNRILNIHPALLPLFGGEGMYGHHVHEAVIASGAQFSGATVHLVDEEYDRGPVVLQKTVPVEKGDTPETLAARVLKIEHEIYPLALKAFAENRVIINERSVWIH
ncbi:MAG: phosphoribosylglycinamide formyltransferase [Ignavibacteriales bacterium]|nr:phosphoribosylglycinamide formyltransferase [Ignavibacteriales bacterium]